MQFIPGPPPHVGTADAAPPSQTVLRIDPNVASRAELMLLPRIGPALADYIIEHRESRAPELAFMQPEDLDRVHRVGPLTVERLRPYLRFDSAEPPLVRKVAE